MDRPIRPIALVLLTACMIYPGITALFQGLYPFVAGEYFTLVNKAGLMMDLAVKFGIPPIVPLLLKAGIGAALVFGVLGLWAGEWRAYPLALLGAAGSLLLPGAPMLMGVAGLVALLGFREDAKTVLA